MLIQEKPLKHWINNFYGYGSWDARFWFVDYEEGGGDAPEEVADKINYFYRVHPQEGQPTLCNIRDLYQNVAFTVPGPRAGLFSNLYEYRFDKNAIQHGEWKNIIAFTHGYLGKQLPNLLTYQKKSLALPPKSKEALIRLYPLPAHNHAWYYSWLDLPQLPFLKNRSLYEEHVYQNRMNAILAKMQTHKPEVVVMYGMDNINLLKQSVQEFFQDAKFKMIKAIKQQIPQHHKADLGGTTLIITTQIPALRHNRIESGFDWEEFGKTVNNK